MWQILLITVFVKLNNPDENSHFYKFYLVGILRNYSNRELATRQLDVVIETARASSRVPQRQPAPRGARRISRQVHGEIVEGYESGLAVIDLARKYNISKTTVIGHLNRDAVTRRPRSMSTEQIDQAQAMYIRGLSLANIGGQLGFDSTTVLKELRKRNVRTRDTHGRERD